MRCSVNGELRQDGSTADVTYDVAFLIEYLAAIATCCPVISYTPAPQAAAVHSLLATVSRWTSEGSEH